MYKIFQLLRVWFARLGAVEPPRDPTACMSLRDLADLPVHHPRFDRDCLN